MLESVSQRKKLTKVCNYYQANSATVDKEEVFKTMTRYASNIVIRNVGAANHCEQKEKYENSQNLCKCLAFKTRGHANAVDCVSLVSK